MSREYAKEEIRSEFLNHIRGAVHYWDGKLNDPQTQRERLEGLAFSILVLLDGGTDFPGCVVIPDPHHDDKEDAIENDSDYYHQVVISPELKSADIAGSLHEYWCKPERDFRALIAKWAKQ